MYSLVMMAALATGADATPAPVAVSAPVVLTSCGGCCGFVTTCHGCCGFVTTCHGCCGFVTSCHGCFGGCHGGHFFGKLRGWFGHKHGCISYGCCGFAWGPVCGGYGCGWVASCVGCYGCYGTWSVGGAYLAPYGVQNIGGSGAPAPTTPMDTAPPATAPMPKAPTAPTAPTLPAPPPVEPKTSANIKFVLPADAKLYVDGQPTRSTGSERPFYTPSLTPGRKYYYDVRAEVVVNGETIVEEKRVIVQAGDDLRESFGKLLAAVAKAGDAVAAK